MLPPRRAHDPADLRFRLPDCNAYLVQVARAELRVFPAVKDVVHRGCDIVSVIYEGPPQASAWVAQLDEHGVRLEILIDEDLTAGAA
jgi:hypothetical protein